MDETADDSNGYVAALPPEDTIVCVDCGGTAHLLTPSRDDGTWFVGDITTYRCSECRDRWDLVLEAPRIDTD